MILEAYVSYKVAKLLKEKGFDEPCHSGYCKHPKTGVLERIGLPYPATNSDYDEVDVVIAPTHQMALRWLREIHNIAIDIVPASHNGEWRFGEFTWKVHTHQGTDSFLRRNAESFTYEEATERAIWHALKNVVGQPYNKAILYFHSTYPNDLEKEVENG